MTSKEIGRIKDKGHQSYWNRIVDYDQQTFSVFADKNAKNPIFDYLKSKSRNSIVADLGCGPGNFLPFLSQQFQKVIAVDYSRALLQKAKERYSQLPNIEYKKIDMRDLSSLYNSLDIAISVNSLLPETVKEANEIIAEFYKSVKLNGEFVGILPSVDVVVHLALLEHQELLAQGVEEREVTRKVEEKFGIDRQFYVIGLQRDSQEQPRQKYFYPFEIKWRFKKAGFSSVNLKKVYYSWQYCRNHHYGYFPEYERIWDWFVIAKKVRKGPKFYS